MRKDAVEFLEKFKDPKITFQKVFIHAKKDIVLQDEDEFMDSMIDYLKESFGMSEEDSEEYASLICELWEECSCSMTSFDREAGKIKDQL